MLPVGVHDCTLDEIQARFGSFQGGDRRPRWFSKLESFVAEARAARLVQSVIVEGSFVTAKPDPNDIDLLVVVPASHDFSADLNPAEYNVLSKRRIGRRLGFDLLVASAESDEYRRYVSQECSEICGSC